MRLVPTAIAASTETPPAARTVDLDVSVCIANWNCAPLLRRCLQSLLDQPQGVRFEVIVVDNASTDGAAEMVAAEFPQVVLVRNVENRGFAAASNQAAARAKGRYLFFLNNDTEVPPHALGRLLAHAAANPTAGMFGPLLREPNGDVQISYRRRPTVSALLHKLSLLRWTGLLSRGVQGVPPRVVRARRRAAGGSADGAGGVHRPRGVRFRGRLGRAVPVRRRGHRPLDAGGKVASR